MSASSNQKCSKMERNGDTAIITLAGGRIRDADDMIAPELQECADDLVGCHLLLDFTNIVQLASLELGTLIGLNRKMKTEGGRLTLFNLNTPVFGIFQVTQLQKLIAICREEQTVVCDGPLLPKERSNALIHSMSAAWFRCPRCQRDWDVQIADGTAHIVPSADRIRQLQRDGQHQTNTSSSQK